MPRESRRTPPAVFVQHHEEGRYSPARSMYNLYRQSGPDQYKHGIMMEVTHGTDRDAYAYPGGGSRGAIELRVAAEQDLDDAEFIGKPKLFGHGHTPGESTVTYAEGTKESRVHALTLGTLAAEETMTRQGRELQVDDDRSPHSEALVQSLTRKLGKQFSKQEHINDMDFLPETPTPVPMATISEDRPAVSAGRVERARLQGREIAAGGPKLGPPKPENEQLTLF